jgi:hypothetical protein
MKTVDNAPQDVRFPSPSAEGYFLFTFSFFLVKLDLLAILASFELGGWSDYAPLICGW